MTGKTAFERYAESGPKMADVELAGGKSIRLDSLVDFMDFSDGDWHKVRIWPGLCASAQLWIDIKKRDGTIIQIPKSFHNFDVATARFDPSKECPYFKHKEEFTNRGEPGGRVNVHYYCNVLDRALQENKPKKAKPPTKAEAKTGFKEKGSKSWSPVRVARFPKTVIEKILKLQALSIADGKQHEISDPDKGQDIYIMYDKNASSPANMWDVAADPEGSTKLSKAERAYLFYDIETAIQEIQSQETLGEAKTWVKQHLKIKQDGFGNGDAKKAGKSLKKAKKARKKVEDEVKARKENKKVHKEEMARRKQGKKNRKKNPPPF